MLEDVKLLVEQGVNLNAQDSNPRSCKTALHHAVANKHLAIVKLLVERGADGQIRDPEGFNSVQRAKQTGRAEMPSYFQAPLVAKCKLKDGSQASLEQGLRRAVVKLGVESVTLQDIRLFIVLVDNVNAQDTNPTSRKTALHHAFIHGKAECIELLLAAGADATIRDAQGLTARDYAQKSHSAPMPFLSHQDKTGMQ